VQELMETGIPNPWAEIEIGVPPYYHSADRLLLERHNRRVDEKHRLPLDVYPEPYIGDPKAPVLLLNLNPGYDASSPKFHAVRAVAELCVRNLRHEWESYPFYPLNPVYLQNGGSLWWSLSLRAWTEEFGIERVSRGFFVIEYFPYASPRYRALGEALPSQRYAFALARAKVRAGCVVIIMRQAENWIRTVPELRAGAFTVNNPQSKSLSPSGPGRAGNLSASAVKRVREALRGL